MVFLIAVSASLICGGGGVVAMKNGSIRRILPTVHMKEQARELNG